MKPLGFSIIQSISRSLKLTISHITIRLNTHLLFFVFLHIVEMKYFHHHQQSALILNNPESKANCAECWEITELRWKV